MGNDTGIAIIGLAVLSVVGIFGYSYIKKNGGLDAITGGSSKPDPVTPATPANTPPDAAAVGATPGTVPPGSDTVIINAIQMGTRMVAIPPPPPLPPGYPAPPYWNRWKRRPDNDHDIDLPDDIIQQKLNELTHSKEYVDLLHDYKKGKISLSEFNRKVSQLAEKLGKKAKQDFGLEIKIGLGGISIGGSDKNSRDYNGRNGRFNSSYVNAYLTNFVDVKRLAGQ
jgi:hypothetical protein